jgi:hypothetical protein
MIMCLMVITFYSLKPSRLGMTFFQILWRTLKGKANLSSSFLDIYQVTGYDTTVFAG